MIPKVAWFHWSQNGPEKSWLREQATRTFAKHNPSWRVIEMGTPDDISERGLGVSHEADWTCWRTLAEKGGVVFDTDIIFLRPFPEAWLDCELLAQTSGTGAIFQFAAIGSVQGHELFVEANDQCAKVADIGKPVGWESFGIPFINRLTGRQLSREGLFDLPREAFCAYHWDADVEPMWSPEGPVGRPIEDAVIGVHWYGGHYISRLREPETGPNGGSWLEKLALSQV